MTASCARRSWRDDSLTGGLQSVRGAQHRGGELLHRVDRVRRRAQRFERRQRLPVAEADRVLLDAIGGFDAPAPEAALEEVDVRPAQPGVRGAQVSVEVAPSAAEPGEPEQCQKSLAVGRAIEPEAALDRIRHSERSERGLEWRLPAVERRTHDGDPLGPHAAADQLQQLLRHELERASRPRALEEADCAVDRGSRRRRVLEQRALDVCDRRLGDLVEPRRQFLDPSVGERGQVVDRPAQRRERGAPRLVGDRDRHVRTSGERLHERPLRAGQILEAVREHRLALPGIEVGREPLARRAAQQVAVPELEPVELGAIGRVERGEIAVEVGRIEQPGLELADAREQRLGEAAEAGRPAEAVHACPCDAHRPADEERALCIRDHPSGRGLSGSAHDATEQVVERADRPAQEGRLELEQVALRAVDVRTVRHDEKRLARKRVQIAPKQERHLPGVGRAGDERQTQPTHATSAVRRRLRRSVERA